MQNGSLLPLALVSLVDSCLAKFPESLECEHVFGDLLRLLSELVGWLGNNVLAKVLLLSFS